MTNSIPEESADPATVAVLQELRVGFLIDRWEPGRGGGEAALDLLARRLAAEGAAVTVFSERAREGELGDGIAWRRVRPRGLTRTQRERSLARALVDAAADSGCQVTVGTRHLRKLDLYWPHGGSHGASLAARRLSRGRAPKSTAGGRHRLFLELERALLGEGGARRVVCVSGLVQRELAEAYPACADRLVTIENGVDLDRFHPRERLSAAGRGAQLRLRIRVEPRTPVLLFSAREPRLKGLPQLVAALQLLRELRFHLLVAGIRNPQPWQRFVRNKGLAERATFLPEADPVALAAAADLCVLPTWRDTSSLVILECLASGTPVITTNRAGAASSIRDATAGRVLSNPGDTEALRETIEERLVDFACADEVGRGSVREHVLDRGLEPWLEALVAQVAELGSSES